MRTRLIRAARLALITAQCCGISVLLAQTRPSPDAGQANVTITGIEGGGYQFDLGSGQMAWAPGAIELTDSGGWTKIHDIVDFSPLFIGKRFAFLGDIRELDCFVRVVKGPRGDYSPDRRTRIVTAAHRDFDLGSAAASPGLAGAGVVEVDSDGFARSANAKSGWVNMPAYLNIMEQGARRLVRLYDLTFWIANGGTQWLSVSVGRATVEGGGAQPAAVPVAVSIAAAGAVQAGKAYSNSLLLRVGQHQLRAVLPTLAGNLEFVEDSPNTVNDAAMAGDVEKLKALLQGDPSLVSSKDTLGAPPLELAAAMGKKDAVQLLLANRADVGDRDRYGYTPLHLAAAGGHKDAVELLLAAKADPNARDESARTPLHLVAAGGHKDAAELLLAAKADPNAKNNKGATPLHAAASAGHKNVVDLLLAHQADPNAPDASGATPMHRASAVGHKDVVESLLAAKADPNAKAADGTTPLLWAAGNGKKDMAEFLLNHQAEINARGKDGATPTQWAVSTGHPDVAEFLRQHGGRDFTAEILDASKSGDLEKVRALLKDYPDLIAAKDARPNIPSTGWTPLHFAANAGSVALVDLLLAGGAAVNARSESGDTPLSCATSARHKDVVKLLRQHGAK